MSNQYLYSFKITDEVIKIINLTGFSYKTAQVLFRISKNDNLILSYSKLSSLSVHYSETY